MSVHWPLTVQAQGCMILADLTSNLEALSFATFYVVLLFILLVSLFNLARGMLETLRSFDQHPAASLLRPYTVTEL